MFSTNTVTVVTAGTGHRNLGKCLASVQGQTFAGVEHWVVVDGEERREAVERMLADNPPTGKRRHVVTVPEATGKMGWCGHRIYAAACFLVNTEFVCFLDEDNWFEPEHVASLVDEIRKTQAMWGFALRNIVDEVGKFVVRDVCESLGNLHHVFNDKNEFLVDTNCYLLPREVAVRVAPIWYSDWGHGSADPDRVMCRTVLEHWPKAASNRRHTVNYTVGTRGARSVAGDFFLAGFQAMRTAYPTGLPWEKAS